MKNSAIMLILILSACGGQVQLPAPQLAKNFETRLYEANKAINEAIEYKVDPEDVWQTPEETLSLGTGDCEDYALLKRAYVVNHMGIKPQDAQLVKGVYKQYVDGKLYKDWHMYLRVTREGVVYHLDSNSTDISKSPLSSFGYVMKM